MPAPPSRIRYWLGAVPIDAVTVEGLVDGVLRQCAAGEPATLTYLNAHGFREAWTRTTFARLLADFDVVFCDGVGLKLGLGWLGVPLPARMTPPDFVDRIFAGLRLQGRRVFLLGDEEPVVEKAAEEVRRRAGEIVAGYHHGFFSDEDGAQIAELIAAARPALVLVGMGSPRQEEWIQRLRPQVPAVWMAVGGLFRWYSGAEVRGPRWLTDHGLEWLCRLMVQRRRVVRRYLLGLPLFAVLLLRLRLSGIRPRSLRGVS